jgi:polyisoprenoid-binding protein YceI
MCDHSIRLDPSNTTVAFSVRWLGGLTVRGGFMDVRGAIRVPDACVEQAEVHLEVAAASIRSGISLRDRHLRGPQFLDAVRSPAVTFRSTRVERLNGALRVAGVLTLRGIERTVRVDCLVAYTGQAGLRSTVQLGAHFTIPRLLHRVGVATGKARLNPLLYAIGTDVTIDVSLMVPASELLSAMLPALGR